MFVRADLVCVEEIWHVPGRFLDSGILDRFGQSWIV